MSINILSKIVLFHQAISYGNQRDENHSVKITFTNNVVLYACVYVCVSVCVRVFFFGPLHVEQSSRYAWRFRITRFIFAQQFRFFLLCETQISGSRFLDSLHSHSLKHGVSQQRVHVILNASVCRKYCIVTSSTNIYRYRGERKIRGNETTCHCYFSIIF